MNGWLRCNNCYATGYKVIEVTEKENQVGKISNEKCLVCRGKGYIELIQ
jgi:hypothetical protein